MKDQFKHFRDVLEYCACERENITPDNIVRRFQIKRMRALAILENLADCRFIERIGKSHSYRFVGQNLNTENDRNGIDELQTLKEIGS